MGRSNKICAESGRLASWQIARSSWQIRKLAKFASYWQEIFFASLKRRNNGKLASNQAGKFPSWQILFLAGKKQRKINKFTLAKLATLKGRWKGLSACLSSTLGTLSLPGRERNSHPAMRIKKCCST